MNSVKQFSIRTIEVSGLVGALQALRLPFGKECRTQTDWYYLVYTEPETEKLKFVSKANFIMDENNPDIELMSALIKKGDEHGKVSRGIMVWAEINAPRYWHVELDTYRVGAERLSSESTMHIQGRGLSADKLVAMKEQLPEGTMQKRIWMFSYQTLRRIYKQRHDHRLPQWHTFCDWIKTLPFSDQLILAGFDNE